LHQSFSNNKDYDIFFTLVDETLLETHYLQLNHYRIQSWEFYKNVKMTRGDVLNKKFDNVRTLKYFQMYDFNDMKDTELKDKKYN
jgi:hypothetical protein